MNITDIDDKIIKRARQNYLFEKYVSDANSVEQIIKDNDTVMAKLPEQIAAADPDKKIMLERMKAS